MKEKSASDKVDLFEEEILLNHQISLGDEAREQIYWLYDNNVDFTFTITKEGKANLELTHVEDVVGFKLRWH